MIRRLGILVAVIGALTCAPVLADEAADITFWESVAESENPAELEAYLRAFPTGNFVALARIRLKVLQQSSVQGNAEEVDVERIVNISLPLGEVRAVDRIAVDIDARALRRGSNWRVIVVPAGTGEIIDDREAFAELSEAITPTMQRLYLDPAPSGENEVRIYYIPPSRREFELVARATVVVEPAHPGAIIVNQLVNEAIFLGPLRFEAKYRDDTVLAEGEFLRVRTGTESRDLLDLLTGSSIDPVNFVVVYLGHRGGVDTTDIPSELACLMEAEDPVLLDRLAALNLGDDVVVRGTPSIWEGGPASQAIVFNPCRIEF